jgi:hypothetical protein
MEGACDAVRDVVGVERGDGDGAYLMQKAHAVGPFIGQPVIQVTRIRQQRISKHRQGFPHHSRQSVHAPVYLLDASRDTSVSL